MGLVAVGLPALTSWVAYRRHHSITDDAFVEAHIVNVGPQIVSGRIVRFLADENDRVAQGQLLAEIDPIPYRDKVNVARAQLGSALAELNRQRADLDLVRKEVPIQIEIARRTSAAAKADRAKAEESLRWTIDEVEKGIDEARAGVKSAEASLTLAELEYTRFTNLEQRGASPLRQKQQVTQSRDSASAQVDLAKARMAKALASRTQIDVGRRALEAAEKSEQKAAKGIDLAETGYDQIREIELLVKVKEQSVEQARRVLEAAENDLAYTKVRAPFPAIVVKRYRHLGDFIAAGSPLLSLYNPDLLYVEANLEEDRLPGVEPGNAVHIELYAFAEPFRGRVVWVNKATGAQFALMPRNVVSGEFTRVVQRVPVRIQIERDDRWPRLRAGLMATVAIAHGPGNAAWAEEAARAMEELETRYNAPATAEEPARDAPDRQHGRGGDPMTTLIAPPPIAAAAPAAEPPMRFGRQHWLAALAILLVFFTPYQTLVQTVITDDAVRKGIEADEYDMTWVTVAYGVGVIYAVFAGMSLSARIGTRYTLVLGMLMFSAGNVLCGAATGLVALAIARLVEGFGKMLAMVICRVTLYRQFDHALLVAIGFYGVFAYSTRHITPLVNAYLDVNLSWRWMYWAYVPIGIVAALLVWRFIRPNRPPQPRHVPIDWLAVTTFVAWIVAVTFAFAWYRKWGGWSSNEFAVTAVLCVALPIVLIAWLGSGLSPDEHLNRILRSRVYVLCLTTRGLMLLHMVAVLTIIGLYCTELRGYPRITAGWLMVPTSLTMATTTFLTTWFHRRLLRHVWLVVGFVGTAACVWWLSSIDNFTPKEQIPVMLGCWGAFLGLIPPVFLTDEVEGLDPRDMLYAGAIGIIGLVVPIITVPIATGTVVKEWSDRALDVYRNNLRENRPAVEQASARVADYFHQRGLSGSALQQETSRALGGFVTLESVAHGFRSGLRFLSLMMLGIGLVVAVSLAWSARGLRAPPGSGYT